MSIWYEMTVWPHAFRAYTTFISLDFFRLCNIVSYFSESSEILMADTKLSGISIKKRIYRNFYNVIYLLSEKVFN